MWHELGTILLKQTYLPSTRYQLAPSGDTKEAAKDLHDMARVVDSAIYMID
jgi:hypothetical protein